MTGTTGNSSRMSLIDIAQLNRKDAFAVNFKASPEKKYDSDDSEDDVRDSNFENRSVNALETQDLHNTELFTVSVGSTEDDRQVSTLFPFSFFGSYCFVRLCDLVPRNALSAY